MKKVLRFYIHTTVFNRIGIIRVILELPAAIFHELCHILMCIILLQKIEYIRCYYFFKVVEADTNCTLKSYFFQIYHKNRDYFTSFLICVAPVVGVILSIFISYYLTLYLLLAYKGSFLSKQDVLNVKEIFNKL